MTTALGTTAGTKPAEKVIKHIDVDLSACCNEDCSERCTITGKSDANKA